jgi:predicted anti-sigma-YlaC factor YlaD
MHCRQAQDNMTDYIEGRLRPDRHREMQDHLVNCLSCREFSLKLLELQRLIGLEKVTTHDPYMYTRIQSLLMAKETRGQQTSWRRVVQPVFIAVLVLLLVFAGIGIGRNYNYQNYSALDYETELYFLSDIHNGNESVLLTE